MSFARNKKPLIFFLVFFLILDAILAFVLITKSYPFYSRKKFTSAASNDVYPLNFGSFIVRDGSLDKQILDDFLLNGFVTKSPYYDSTLEVMILQIEIKENKKLNIFLGNKEKKLFTLMAHRGELPKVRDKEPLTILSLSKLIKKGHPIIIGLYTQRLPKAWVGIEEECDLNCQKRIQQINKYASSNRALLNSLIDGTEVDTNLLYGPVSDTILYAK